MVREFFRHGSNTALAALASALIGAAVSGGFAISAIWVLLGAVLFHLTEYGFHRFLFHAPPSGWPWLLRLQHRLHYDHHTDPARLDLLFLPLWFALPNLLLTGLAAWGLSGDWQKAASLVLGATLALLHYEWVHYAAHIPYRPRTKFGRWMKKYHLWHHFKNEHYWFGVSNPVLDFLSRTYRAPESVERSASTRILHPEQN
jgi:uncharacterized RDD family membrane protein YckC